MNTFYTYCILIFIGVPNPSQPNPVGRIVGGKDANIEDYPYQVRNIGEYVMKNLLNFLESSEFDKYINLKFSISTISFHFSYLSLFRNCLLSFAPFLCSSIMVLCFHFFGITSISSILLNRPVSDL